MRNRPAYMVGWFTMVGSFAVPSDAAPQSILPRPGRYGNPQFIASGRDEMQIIAGWSTDIITDLFTSRITRTTSLNGSRIMRSRSQDVCQV